MRTTIDIQDDMLDQAKRIAAEKRRTLGDVVSDALRETFFRRNDRSKIKSAPGPMPVDTGNGLLPGVDLDASAALSDILDAIDHRHPGGDAVPKRSKFR